jgi:hypothetical protein
MAISSASQFYVLIFSCTFSFGLCAQDTMFPEHTQIDSKVAGSCKPGKIYRGTALKLYVIDKLSRKTVHLIVQADDVFYLGRKNVDGGMNYYEQLLLQPQTDPLEVSLDLWEKMIGTRLSGSEKLAREYFYKYVAYTEPMSLADLGVDSKRDLLRRYFRHISESNNRWILLEEKYRRLPSFVALLIDLGFCVRWADVFPSLIVEEN